MQETVTFELVRYEVKSRVAEITLNRPPVNAINVQLANEVVAAYRLAKEDSAVRAVILASGLPEVYSAGVDLKLARSFDGQSLRAFIETTESGRHGDGDATRWIGRANAARGEDGHLIHPT